MSTSSLFDKFFKKLAISNAKEISRKYKTITKRLNHDFWETDSEDLNSLQVGSYGRKTAINGISDLDMVFRLPDELLKKYKAMEGNGPSAMFQDVRKSLLRTYSTSKITADRQVVAVHFNGYRVEVLPAFDNGDGHYTYGDSNNGGSWKTTMPRPEIEASKTMNDRTGGVYRHACKMIRAWKNHHGVGMGGLLIDTLVYNFFDGSTEYDKCSYEKYGELMRDLFSYLANLNEQSYWYALGSNQQVKCKSKFQPKAKKAARHCDEAIKETTLIKQANKWRSVFGYKFPKAQALTKSLDLSESLVLSGIIGPRETFIEKDHPVDVRFDMSIDCYVLGEGQRLLLSDLVANEQLVPKGRKLKFFVDPESSNFPQEAKILWKVKNEGEHAINFRKQRGEIQSDTGSWAREETAEFSGPHYVEAYAVIDGVCVARSKIPVPI